MIAVKNAPVKPGVKSHEAHGNHDPVPSRRDL